MKTEIIKTIDDLKKAIEGQYVLCLYGAGTISHKIIQVSNDFELSKKIQTIFVSQAGEEKNIDGIPIVEYQRSLVTDNTKVVIATTAYAEEVLSILKKDGINNIVKLDENFEKLLDAYINRKDIQQISAEKDRIIQEFKKEQRKSDYDIAFLTPPYWDMYSPFSAVPCLKARLKQEGYKVYQIDIGIICMHYAIRKYGKKVAKNLLSKQFFDKFVCGYEKNPYSSHEQYVKDMDFLQDSDWNVKKVKSRYKSMNFVQKCIVNKFYQDIYAADVVDIDFNKCVSISDSVERWNYKFLWNIFEDESVRTLFGALPDVIGISITSTCQFIPGCLLAQLIHQIKPEVKIIFGGSCADLFVNSEYPQKYDIYDYFDFVLIGEGETAATRTLQYIQGETDISQIPNLVVIDQSNQVKVNPVMIEDVLELPVPDYDDLDLELYLSPEIILPYQSSRGCHYGHCAFCNHDEKYRHNYRTKHMEKVVEDLIFLSKKYHTNCFQFVDEAIRPDCFRLLVDEMDHNQEFQNIRWFYYSRVSREYDKDLLEKAYRNGCRMVMFGVESFNQRLLNFIKKGISAETSKYCLKLFHQCGIKTYAWLMDNLPSETVEEAKEDLEEVKRMHEYIDAFSVGPFMLVKNTDMYKNLENYNIVEVNEQDSRRFQSHNNGTIVDKEEMLRFDREEYRKYQLSTFLFGDRYTLFFS